MTPPPPVELPKPLGIDDEASAEGVAQLRTSRSSLSLSNRRAPSLGGAGAASGAVSGAAPAAPASGATSPGQSPRYGRLFGAVAQKAAAGRFG